jgi:hypothetical protein
MPEYFETVSLVFKVQYLPRAATIISIGPYFFFADLNLPLLTYKTVISWWTGVAPPLPPAAPTPAPPPPCPPAAAPPPAGYYTAPPTRLQTREEGEFFSFVHNKLFQRYTLEPLGFFPPVTAGCVMEVIVDSESVFIYADLWFQHFLKILDSGPAPIFTNGSYPDPDWIWIIWICGSWSRKQKKTFILLIIMCKKDYKSPQIYVYV